MTTKIAPTLRRAHPRPPTPREVMQGSKRGEVVTYRADDAWRELVAFLALERAVRRWRCAHPGGLSEDEQRIVEAHEQLNRAGRPIHPVNNSRRRRG